MGNQIATTGLILLLLAFPPLLLAKILSKPVSSEVLRVEQGQPLEFPLSASPSAKVCWFKNGQPVNCNGYRCVVDQGSLKIYSASQKDAGVYKVFYQEGKYSSEYTWHVVVGSYKGPDVRAQVEFPKKQFGERPTVLLCTPPMLSFPSANFTWSHGQKNILSCGPRGCFEVDNPNCKIRMYPPFKGPCIKLRKLGPGCEGTYKLRFTKLQHPEIQFKVLSSPSVCDAEKAK